MSENQGVDEAGTAAARRLADSMAGLAMVIRDYYRTVSEEVSPGLMPATFKALTLILRLAPVSVSKLAEVMMADKGQVSRAITELESRGLVTRTFDPKDARVRLVEPTAEARDRLEVVRNPVAALLEESLAGWEVADIDHVSELLERLAESARTRPLARKS